MDNFIAAQHDREAKWELHVDAYDKAKKTMEDEWAKLKKGHTDLEAKKEALARQNGASDVSATDVLRINAGGQLFCVTRGTLTQVKGSTLEALFSGRWEKQLHQDSKGRIFLDINSACFRSILDYLNECKISPPENPPDLPKAADPENQLFLDSLVVAFGLHRIANIDSRILTDSGHINSLLGFLADDDLGQELTLLYRGTRDGLNATSFHQKCDNECPTVTVVKSTGNYIFGGFSDKPWDGSNSYSCSSKAFLFGLDCEGGKSPVKLAASGLKNHVYCDEAYGPTFGQGHDLTVMNPSDTLSANYSYLGSSYHLPPGGGRYYFTGQQDFSVSEVEVFKVTLDGAPSLKLVSPELVPEHQSYTLDIATFPDDIQAAFQAEKDVLLEASAKLLVLQDVFDKEQAAVNVFLCPKDGDDIVLLNVSGQSMAIKHSTLGKYPDSVLYKHFVDKNWIGRQKRTSISARDWKAKEVVAWSANLQDLSEDVSCHFQDVSGPELLVLGREDIKDLGIQRPGTVALLVDAIQKLREEEDEGSATLIEQSDYCIGKILDHMRLRVMSDLLDLPDPGPPIIREQDKKRFKCIVEYYFPIEESAAQFIA